MRTNGYGQAALEAARDREMDGPGNAWRRAVQRLFPGQLDSQEKGCPKNAFLGLCEEGLVEGVPAGRYTTSKSNKAYALRAVELLRAGTTPTSPKALWTEVMNGEKKAYNNQCDVVLALWEERLIDRR